MFKSRKLNIIIISSLFIFIFFIGINSVFAKSKVTQTLDLTSHPSEDRLSDEGWSWDASSKTLILQDATFEMTDGGDTKNPCIKFLNSEDITVIFEGVNNLTADKESVFLGEKDGNGGTLTFKSTNNGTLNLNIKNYYTTGGGNGGNTIGYPYNLNIESGTINSNGGFLVDGVVTISGGNLNIDAHSFPKTKGIYALRQVNITGGNVDIKSSGSAIMVTGTSGIDDYSDGVVISGGNINLTATDARNPSIYAGYLKHKNIVINGGDITLNSDFGIYTAKGIISVNNVDSFNVDNVRLDVFKIGTAEGNEIKVNNADYSKVDEAIKRANSLNKSNYKNFNLVEQAIAAVVRGKNILEQSEVDEMALAINKAIDSLKLNDEMQNIVNPNTSDINIGLLLILIILSGLGIVYTVKRRFN